MREDLENKYFVKKGISDEWEDVTTMFDGVKVLTISGFNERGKAVNVYTEQWINEPSQEEDFLITTSDEHDNPVIVRENVDIELTFIVGNKYATNAIDVEVQHEAFIDYMTKSDVYIKTRYYDKEVHCVCLETYKPTVVKLQRRGNSYMMGTVKLHTLEIPKVSD